MTRVTSRCSIELKSMLRTQASDPPASQIESAFHLGLDNNYYEQLASMDAMADTTLTYDELAADPEGAALIAALQSQIASYLGSAVDPAGIAIFVSAVIAILSAICESVKSN